jgi:predicted HTH domain antitoxin
MNIEVPDKFAARVQRSEVLLDLASGMYAAGHLTLGQTAELAGISQGELQKELGSRGIAAHYDLDDLADDLKTVADLKRS